MSNFNHAVCRFVVKRDFVLRNFCDTLSLRTGHEERGDNERRCGVKILAG